MSLKTLHGAAWLLCCSAVAATAQAYSLPSRFGVAAEAGGGGGRHFTGSLLDAYTCDSCHTAAKPADWTLSGLPPAAGYTPGALYEITVDWPEDAALAGLAFEALSVAAQTAGLLAEIPVDQLEARDRCADGTQATLLLPAGERRILTTIACGAKQTRFRWTAPSFDNTAENMPTALWLSAAHVQGDGSGTPSGDAFGKQLQQVRLASSEPPPIVANQTCQIGTRTKPSQALAWLLVWLCLRTAYFLPGSRCRVR